MPTVHCPGCGREIAVSVAEIEAKLALQCAGCNRHFAAGQGRLPATTPPVRRRIAVADDEDEEEPTGPLAPIAFTNRAERSQGWHIAFLRFYGSIMCLGDAILFALAYPIVCVLIVKDYTPLLGGHVAWQLFYWTLLCASAIVANLLSGATALWMVEIAERLRHIAEK